MKVNRSFIISNFSYEVFLGTYGMTQILQPIVCGVGVYAGTGYIHSAEVATANIGERDIAPSLVRADDEAAYGDAGYSSIEKLEEICRGSVGAISL